MTNIYRMDWRALGYWPKWNQGNLIWEKEDYVQPDIDNPSEREYTQLMHIYRVSLLDYDNSFDLDLFAQTEEEARSMASKEEPNMTITRVVCLTS